MTAFILTTLAFLTAAQASVVTGGSGFCERMAAETGMKPVKDARATSFQVNKLGGIGTFLFGGSVTFMLSVKPDAGSSDAVIAANDCKPEGKTVACTVMGPATLNLTVNEQTFTFPARADDKAKVSIINGKSLRCDTLQ